jgi:chromosome segregation ATPase
VQQHESTLANLKAQLEAETVARKTLSATHEETLARETALKATLETAQQKIAEQDGDITKSREEVAQLRDETTTLHTQLAAATTALDEEKKVSTELRESTIEAEGRVASAQSEQLRLEQAVASRDQLLETLRTKLKEQETTLADKEAIVTSQLDAVSRLHTEVTALREERTRLLSTRADGGDRATVASLEEQLEQLTQELIELEEQRNGATMEVSQWALAARHRPTGAPLSVCALFIHQ